MSRSSGVLTREQILNVTEETIRRFGVQKTSVTDVSKALNVSHGTIYRHFNNKAEIMEASTEKWLKEKILTPLSKVCEEDAQTGSERLRVYIQTLIQLKRHYAEQDRELFDMYAKVTNESSDMIERHIDEIVEQMSELITQSELKSLNPVRVARSVFYATTRFHHPAHANEWTRSSIDKEFNDVWKIVESGLLNCNGGEMK